MSLSPSIERLNERIDFACRKNGEHLGSAFRHVVATALVPTIGLHR